MSKEKDREIVQLREENDGWKDHWERIKLGFFGVVSLVLYALLVLFFPLLDPVTQVPPRAWLFGQPTAGALEFRMALGGALVSFGAFGVFLQALQFKSMDREVTSAMTKAFSNSASFIHNLNNLKKRDLVENALEALLGPKIGPSTYKYIEPMLEEEAGFRTDFKYRVWLMDHGELSDGAFADWFSREDYRWIHEDISYKLMKPTRTGGEVYDPGPFTVYFLFDKPTLELTNPKKDVFARFLIELGDAELLKLCDFSEDEAKTFLVEIIQPKLWEVPDEGEKRRIGLDECVVRFERPFDSNNSNCMPYFSVKMKEPLENLQGRSKLRLEFQYPYIRAATHFIFTLPQPVYSPTLSFDFTGAQVEPRFVNYSSYLSCSDPRRIQVEEPKISRRELSYEVSVKDAWVYPTSGVTFVWQNPSE